MPRNGSGTYTRPQSDYVSGTTILASSVNSDLNDMATALTASIARDGQTTPTGNLPMGGFRHTGVANGAARTDYAALGQAQDGAFLWGGTAGGTANAITISLNPPIAAYGAGQTFQFIASAANTGAVTLNVNSVGAVAVNKGDGTTALIAGDIPNGAMITARHDGTRFRLIDPATPDSVTPTEVDLASAATTDLSAVGSNVRITGTTTITSFGTVANGVTRQLRFAAALTLTHNATSLILPGGANITTAAGDTATARSLGSGNWVVTSYTRAAAPSAATMTTARVLGRITAGSGAIEEIALGNAAAALSLGVNRGTEQATTSGTAIDFTSIPAGVRRITVVFNQVSTNGSAGIGIRLGTSGGIVSSGYDSSVTYFNNSGSGSGAPTDYFPLWNGSAADTNTGVMALLNISGNIWVASYNGMMASGAQRFQCVSGGVVTLSSALTQLRLTSTTGSSTFDNGSINIMWEF